MFLGFHGCLPIDCEGRSGGLVLLWKNMIKMRIIQYSKFHIHGYILNDGIGWYLMVNQRWLGETNPGLCFLLFII